MFAGLCLILSYASFNLFIKIKNTSSLISSISSIHRSLSISIRLLFVIDSWFQFDWLMSKLMIHTLCRSLKRIADNPDLLLPVLMDGWSELNSAQNDDDYIDIFFLRTAHSIILLPIIGERLANVNASFKFLKENGIRIYMMKKGILSNSTRDVILRSDLIRNVDKFLGIS